MKLEKVHSKLKTETEYFAFKVKVVPVLANSHNFYSLKVNNWQTFVDKLTSSSHTMSDRRQTASNQKRLSTTSSERYPSYQWKVARGSLTGL